MDVEALAVNLNNAYSFAMLCILTLISFPSCERTSSAQAGSRLCNMEVEQQCTNMAHIDIHHSVLRCCSSRLPTILYSINGEAPLGVKPRDHQCGSKNIRIWFSREKPNFDCRPSLLWTRVLLPRILLTPLLPLLQDLLFIADHHLGRGK